VEKQLRMINKRPRSIFYLLVICLLALVGCIIPESNHIQPDFFLLSHTSSDANQSKAKGDHSFYLREIELPQYLKDSRMVVRPTSHTIIFRDSDRWGEPLEDGIARVLALNLQEQIYDSIYSVFPNRRKDGLRWDLAISFSRFEKISNDRVLINSKWTAKQKKGVSISDTFSFEMNLPIGGGDSDELKAYNLAIYKLSEEIIGQLPLN
jgi:uncharacterized protein